MQIIEIVDPREIRRVKRAQYGGFPTNVELNGTSVRGLVVSVKKPDRLDTSAWTIEIVLMPETPLGKLVR